MGAFSTDEDKIEPSDGIVIAAKTVEGAAAEQGHDAVATKADASCDDGMSCRACTTEEDCDECGGIWQPNFPPTCLVLSAAAAAAATHDLQHLPTPTEEQKDLVAINKGTAAVEAALQDNTVNECPPSDNPAAIECSVQCESLCMDFLRVECCYEQGGVCFCDT